MECMSSKATFPDFTNMEPNEFILRVRSSASQELCPLSWKLEWMAIRVEGFFRGNKSLSESMAGLWLEICGTPQKGSHGGILRKHC